MEVSACEQVSDIATEEVTYTIWSLLVTARQYSVLGEAGLEIEQTVTATKQPEPFIILK